MRLTLSSEMSPIRKFYAGKSILVTGATGFIGKVLIEKLLYSCPELDKIYLLIRSSKGKSPNQRLLDMTTQLPFTARLKQDLMLRKLVAINGDLGEPNLGLSDKDRDTLVDHVALVFHVAASVKFDAPVKVNMKQNVCATKQLLDLATKFGKLKCFVHVSTAYSNCQLSNIDERVYHMQVPEDPEQMRLSEESLGGRPNSYTLTKAIAENVVTRYADRMNIVIARPSIVMSSQLEPMHGWVDTVNGPVGLSVLGAVGILQSIKMRTDVVFDLIPVDIVSNALVAIGWAAVERRKEFADDRALRVFNLTSGSENPCTFYQYFRAGRQEALDKPSQHVLRPILHIPKQKGMNAAHYWVRKVLSHLLFAYIIDMMLYLQGKKRMAIKAVEKMHHANEMFDYFCKSQWVFNVNNVARLRDILSPSDKDTFNCDVRQVDWDEYGRTSWMGCRRFILKEDDDTFMEGRRRYRKMCILYYLVKIFLLLVVTVATRYCFRSYPMSTTVGLLAPVYGAVYIV